MRRYVETAGLVLAALIASPIIALVQAGFPLMPPKIGTAYSVVLAVVAIRLACRSLGTAIRDTSLQLRGSLRVVLLTALATNGIATTVTYWIVPGTPSSLVGMVVTPWRISSMLLTVLLIAPVLEETVFRGMLLTRLRHRWSPEVSVVISATTFAYIHEDPTRFISQLAAGLLLGGIVIVTGRLWLAMITHGMINVAGLPFGVFTASDLSERIGLVYPALFMVLTLLAVVELRRVLIETRWRAVRTREARVMVPASWDLDAGL